MSKKDVEFDPDPYWLDCIIDPDVYIFEIQHMTPENYPINAFFEPQEFFGERPTKTFRAILDRAFNRFDEDGDGFLRKQEFKKFSHFIELPTTQPDLWANITNSYPCTNPDSKNVDDRKLTRLGFYQYMHFNLCAHPLVYGTCCKILGAKIINGKLEMGPFRPLVYPDHLKEAESWPKDEFEEYEDERLKEHQKDGVSIQKKRIRK